MPNQWQNAQPTQGQSQVPDPSDLARIRRQRERIETRHTQGLTRLMGARADLRGVHALADLVDDAVRWSA